MRALSKRDSMYSVGNQIGVGKESGEFVSNAESRPVELKYILPDIYIVADAEGNEMVLKLHRCDDLNIYRQKDSTHVHLSGLVGYLSVQSRRREII